MLQGQKRSGKKTEFIGRWFNIVKSLKEKDALIVSSYLDYDILKIGLLTKDSCWFELPRNNEYKVFQVSNTIEISNRENQIFSALIPARATISPLHKRINFMIHKYTGLPLNIDISNISEKSLEVICLEWLRSDLCPNIYKLKFQLLLTGGNYGKVDAYGQTFNNKTLAAQITFSHSKSVINKKLKNLNTFSSDMKLLFCDLETDYHNEIPVISIREVWKDLFENGYSELLEKLINE